jgi:hypothetical protein
MQTEARRRVSFATAFIAFAGHGKAVTRGGATLVELMGAIWVAAEMRGAAFAHSLMALDALDEDHAHDAQE